MTKKTLKYGNNVDDGTGDYLLEGARKIQGNFDELYSNLGDGLTPHAAGAWKTHNGPTALSPEFGEAYNINTTLGEVMVTLPKGVAADYGKVIKLRDIHGTWGTNYVTLIPGAGNTIKGSGRSKVLARNHQDVELVLTSPGSWEYVENKLLDRISMTDISTVAKQEIIATDAQKDFVDIFGDTKYNPKNLEVYRRGNLLYYGKDFTENSEYGSIGEDGAIVALDGSSVRLRDVCSEGDVITFITYLDDVAVYRTSYTSRSLTVYNTESGKPTIPGQTWVGDLSKKRLWSISDFGLSSIDGQLNPFATEVVINGHILTMGGRGGLPAFTCETTDGDPVAGSTEEECQLAGGQWVESGIDFSVVEDESGNLSQIKIHETLEDGDVINLRWYNNDIGTTLTIDQIKHETDKLYLNNEMTFNQSDKIRYNDYDNPNPCNVEKEAEPEVGFKLTDVSMLLDTIYPVGTVYMNAHNDANPEKYMGFGKWVPYAEGQSIVGWDRGSDEHFTNYTGDCGTVKSPGGSGGSKAYEIKSTDLPTLESKDEVLIKDENGTILVGSCLLDPDEGPGYNKYREDILQVNKNDRPNPISLIQPYVTVAAWLRVL